MGLADLAGVTIREPNHQLSRAPRSQPFVSCIIMFCAFGVVYCSCIALPSFCSRYSATMRPFRNDDVALGRFVDGRDDHRRGVFGTASRCPLVSWGRTSCDGNRQLRTLPNESRNRALASHLATCRWSCWALDLFLRRSAWPLTSIFRSICAARRSACSACFAPKAAASVLQLRRSLKTGRAIAHVADW